MSFLTRPGVVFAIVFGCFAVLIPRIFLPYFRTKSPTSSHNYDDHLRRPPHPMHRDDNADQVQHIPGSPPHMRGAHPNMRMHHPGASNRQQPTADPGGSRSIVALALPMYTAGIGVFFLYTCCKYWSKRNSNGEKATKADHLLNLEKRKKKCEILDRNSEEEEEGNKEEFYARLDPDYLEYLNSKKQKALEAEQAMTDEQKQMHYALEEMKKSLSFISAKLVTKETRGNLNGTEINKLQERLASTEAQMCQILTALDAASDKVTRTPKKKKKKIQQLEEEEEKVQRSSEGESVSSSEDEEDEGVPDQDESTNSSNSSDAEGEEEEEDQSIPVEKPKSD